MKRSLQVVSAAVLLTIASVTAQAQGGGGGGMGGGMGGGGRGMQAQMDMMLKDITLTPAQKTQVDTIMAQGMKKQMEARAAMAPGTQMTPEDRKKMMDDRNAAIKKVLTADQATVFDKNVAAMPMGRGRGGF
jgi:Spy/CpxP family protein refolding chaperone